MKVEFKNSFAKDLRRIKGERLKTQIREVIEHTELAADIQQIENLKKLKGAENYFRIKLGDYRFGLIIENDVGKSKPELLSLFPRSSQLCCHGENRGRGQLQQAIELLIQSTVEKKLPVQVPSTSAEYISIPEL